MAHRSGGAAGASAVPMVAPRVPAVSTVSTVLTVLTVCVMPVARMVPGAALRRHPMRYVPLPSRQTLLVQPPRHCRRRVDP